MKANKADPHLPIKVMPAPPPKENAWVKRNSAPPPNRSLSSESSQSGGERHDSDRRQSGTGQGKDESKEDDLEPESVTSGRSPTSDRNEKQDPDSKQFTQASKYAALSVDGGEEEEPEEYVD